MDDRLTRRAAVSALTTVAAFGLIPAPAGARPLQSSAWTSALSRYRAANAAFGVAVDALNNAQEAYFARRPERPTFVMEVEGDYGRFGKHVLPITIMHDELDDPARQWADPERIDEMRRELAAFRIADAALRDELRLDEIEGHESEASELQTTALRALIATPAPDLQTLAEKLAIVLDQYGDEDGATSAVLADVRQLTGAA